VGEGNKMKQRTKPLSDREAESDLDALSRAFATLEKPAEVRAFLEDLCTPAELEAMCDRWKVVPLLLDRIPYGEIHTRTLVSITTIGRVARTLARGTGGYEAAMRRFHRRRNT
jgi:TrpR-related protein YerC/YecD